MSQNDLNIFHRILDSVSVSRYWWVFFYCVSAFAFLCLVISVGAQRSYRLTCYLDVLTHRTHEGPCSHIILPLTPTDDDLYLQSLSEVDSVTIRMMKERNPTLKILLGLEIKSSRLELMSANEAGVETFVQTVLTYLKHQSLDGVDVTWLDGPSSGESSRTIELFTNFLKSLKGAFEGETQPLLLSVSVLELADHSAVTYNEPTLSQYVDFISILPAHLEKDGPYIVNYSNFLQFVETGFYLLALKFSASRMTYFWMIMSTLVHSTKIQ